MVTRRAEQVQCGKYAKTRVGRNTSRQVCSDTLITGIPLSVGELANVIGQAIGFSVHRNWIEEAEVHGALPQHSWEGRNRCWHHDSVMRVIEDAKNVNSDLYSFMEDKMIQHRIPKSESWFLRS